MTLFKRKYKDRKTGKPMESPTWYCRVKDLDGKRQRVALTTNKTASMKAALALEDAVAQVSAGATVPPQELPSIVQDDFLKILEKSGHKLGRVRSQIEPLSDHLEDYVASLKDKRCSDDHIKYTRRRIERLAEECGWATLAKIDAIQTVKAFERWKLPIETSDGEEKPGMGPRTRNTYLSSIKAFIKWCMECSPPRMDHDPLAQVLAVNEEADIRHERRALSEEEIRRLLEIARTRPLQNASTIGYGKNAGKSVKSIKPEYAAKLKAKGRQRSLQYQTLITLGLRLNELKKLRWCDLDLGDRPQVTIWGKGQRFDTLPVSTELADDLAAWRNERQPTGVTDLVFDVPNELVKRLRKDLEAAGIPYEDDTGRFLDVHALRHTTATRHARAGTAPRVAQSLMRHSSLELTMKVYTDPKLLNEQAAVDSLPRLKTESKTKRKHG